MSKPGRDFKAVCLCGIVLCGIFFFLGTGGQFTQAATSATFTVNTTAEVADVNPGDGVCADASGNCSLRAAVQEANALAGANTITLPAGTYYLTNALNVSQNLTINGAGQATTILDGAGSSGAKGFTISPDYDLELNDVTLRDFPQAVYIPGDASNHGTVTLNDCTLRDLTNTDPSNSGSAIANYCEGCTVNLNNVQVYNNRAPGCGAISNYGALNIGDGSSIHDNQATAGVGGAICNDGGNLSVMLSSIYNNIASGVYNNPGGGIYQSSGSTAIYQGQIFNNSADNEGGGAYIGGGSFSILYSTLSGNSGTSGGGLFLNTSITAEIDATVIDNNQASYGGGIYTSKTVNIENSAIVSNTASTDGGGIRVQNGAATLINSTVSGNQANRDGAGLSIKNTTATKLGSATISNNTADADDNGDGTGGGIHVDSGSSVMIKNSIVAGNEDLTAVAFEVYSPDCVGPLTSQGYNLIGRWSSMTCSVSGDMSGVLLGSLSPGIDAGLGNLTLGSYSTYHHLPLWGPAIDRGNPAGCSDFSGAALAADQRGEARIFGAGAPGYTPRCDLGAVESSLKRFDLFLPAIIRMP